MEDNQWIKFYKVIWSNGAITWEHSQYLAKHSLVLQAFLLTSLGKSEPAKTTSVGRLFMPYSAHPDLNKSQTSKTKINFITINQRTTDDHVWGGVMDEAVKSDHMKNASYTTRGV